MVLDDNPDADVVNAIAASREEIFHLVDRLFAQIERVAPINDYVTLTTYVVGAPMRAWLLVRHSAKQRPHTRWHIA